MASASPIPAEAPVTQTTLPLTSDMITVGLFKANVIILILHNASKQMGLQCIKTSGNKTRGIYYRAGTQLSL
jgi:hypothetical protein